MQDNINNKSKTIAIAIGGFVAGIIVMLIVIKIAAPGMMIHETKSPYDFNTTVTTIVSNAENINWKVTKVYDFQKSIQDAGKGDVGRIKVIEICQPEYASGLLGKDENNLLLL